jgi:hypothetical protein
MAFGFLRNIGENFNNVCKGKAFSLQAWTGPEGSTRLRKRTVRQVGETYLMCDLIIKCAFG